MSVKKIAGKKEQLERDIRDLRRKAGQATSMRLRQKMLAALEQLQEELAQLEKRKASAESTPATIKYRGRLYKRADAAAEIDILRPWNEWLQQHGSPLVQQVAKLLAAGVDQAMGLPLPATGMKELTQWLQWVLIGTAAPPTWLAVTSRRLPPAQQLKLLLIHAMTAAMRAEDQDLAGRGGD